MKTKNVYLQILLFILVVLSGTSFLRFLEEYKDTSRCLELTLEVPTSFKLLKLERDNTIAYLKFLEEGKVRFAEFPEKIEEFNVAIKNVNRFIGQENQNQNLVNLDKLEAVTARSVRVSIEYLILFIIILLGASWLLLCTIKLENLKQKKL